MPTLYEIHPHADIFPQMQADEYESLVADIDACGVLVPITLYQGRILDGRHRWQAVQELKEVKGKDVPHSFVTFEGTPDDALRFVFSANLMRRHLNDGQRSILAAENIPYIKEVEGIQEGGDRRSEEFKENQKCQTAHLNSDNSSSPKEKDKRAAAKSAKLFNVSTRGVGRAKRILDNAPDLAEDVRSGETKLFDAEKELKKRQVQEKRRELSQSAAEEKDTEDCLLLVGDFRQFGSQIPDNSVNLIFTDPPYDKASAELYADLAQFAARVLVPGGICMAYTGQMHLPEVLTGMREHLDYLWTCAITHSGGDLWFRKWNLSNGWKPVVMFGKPPVLSWWERLRDVATGGKEKGEHNWQQAIGEAEHYVSKLCISGGVVCDPFCGSGTSLAAAAKLGMRVIGIDEDAADIQMTRKRVMECRKTV